MKERVFEKGMKKRLLSVVLAMAMVILLLPMSSITSYAKDWTPADEPVNIADLAPGDTIAVHTIVKSTEPIYMFYIGEPRCVCFFSTNGEDVSGFSKYPFTGTTSMSYTYTIVGDVRIEHDNKSGKCHHDYAWTTIQKPTLTSDGKQAYKCVKCGHVNSDYSTQPVSAYKYAGDEAAKQIQSAAQGATINIDYGVFNTFSKDLLETIKTRPDLTITFKYKVGKVVYERTIGPNIEFPAELPDYAGPHFLDCYSKEIVVEEMAY